MRQKSKIRFPVDKIRTFTYDNSIRERQRTERVAVKETDREGLSPAESSPRWKCCEVHPGVDPANVRICFQ